MAIYLLSISLLSIERNFSKFLAEMIIVWISGVIALVFIVFILLLLGFHIYLGYHCMTTYNFVHKNKKRKITPSMSFLNIGSVAKNKVFPECYEPNGVKNSC
jgi:predicted membrane protein